jgi:3-oxoacyl-[acyl-carrier protein] reductase
MDLGLKGKIALVSGSSGGIGEAIAVSLAGEGVTVVVNGRTAKSVSAAIARIREAVPNSELRPLVADLGTAEGCARAIAEVPAVDVLVNNLGMYEPSGFFDASDSQWQRLIEVNVMSGVRLSRHYLKRMLDRNAGRVIFIASESGINPAPEMPHYSATKTMEISLSRNLAELTKGSRVTVNALLPGPCGTPGVVTFAASLFPGVSAQEQQRRFMANRPTSLIQRLVEPREVGDFVAFIASERAGAVNGAALRIDGGVVRSVF